MSLSEAPPAETHFEDNHLRAVPTIEISPQIWACELIAPSGDGTMSLHKIWVPPNVAYPLHTHPSPHIITVLEGGGSGSIIDAERRETVFRLDPGTVFNVPAHYIHKVGADVRGMIMLAVSVGSKPLTDPDRLRISL